jgi:serine/threonine-protein kinase
MGDALSGYLYSKQLKVNSFDIATLVKAVIESRKASKAGGPQEVSIIDRLIQEELLRFTSLDDLSDPVGGPAKPASPDDLGEGAQPLDAGSFENPADWFSDDEDVVGAIGRAATTKSEPGWRESGLEDAGDLSSVLEDDARSEPVPPAPAPRRSNPADARTSRPTPEPGFSRPPAAPQPQQPAKSGSGAGMYVVIAIVVVVLGAGAAAWFGGIIPH